MFYSVAELRDSALYRVDTRTGEQKVIAKDDRWSLQVFGDRLFYTGDDGIASSNFDGGDIVRYADTVDAWFWIHDGAIFYPADDDSGSGVHRVDIASREAVKLNGVGAKYLTFAAGSIFYESVDDLDEETIEDLFRGDVPNIGQLYQMNLDGTGAKRIGEKFVYDLQEYDGVLYYMDFEGGFIEKFDPATSLATTVGEDKYNDINVTNGKIYASGADAIYVLDLSGKELAKYATDSLDIFLRDVLINVVGSSIYFTTVWDASVYRIDTEQDRIEVLYTAE